MTDSALQLQRLCFSRTPGASIRLHQRLVRHAPPEMLGLPMTFYTDMGIKDRDASWLSQPDWDLVRRDADMLAAMNMALLWYEDESYPWLLAETAYPPVALYVRGMSDVLQLPQLAVVGTRHPSHAGKGLAHMFAQALVSAGICITSGFAQGIDAAAHEGALRGKGQTVAVFGCGVDHIYPRGHEFLARHILDAGGALVSEMPPGTPPLPSHFPRRTRIIRGLAQGTLVVEATLRSGSLITARMAAEQGREVFAIPGPIQHPRSRGCHWLIRQGAKLVETVDDILQELTRPAVVSASGLTDAGHLPDDADAIELLSHIAYGPTTVDTLVTRTGLPASLLGPWLTRLELEGLVTLVQGGAYIRSGLGGMGVRKAK